MSLIFNSPTKFTLFLFLCFNLSGILFINCTELTIKAQNLIAAINTNLNHSQVIIEKTNDNVESIGNEMFKNKKNFENYENNKLFLEHKAGIFIKSDSVSFFDSLYILKYASLLITIGILILVGYYLYLFINNKRIKEDLNSFSKQETYYQETEDFHTIPQEKMHCRMYITNLLRNNVFLRGRSKKFPKSVKYSDLFVEGNESEGQSKN